MGTRQAERPRPTITFVVAGLMSNRAPADLRLDLRGET